MQEKYGFVYIWYDRKHKRYYVGCHWGTEDDGYICSSPWMKQGYNLRPNDFKRRILKNNILNKKALLEEEYKWLMLIKKEELGKRYYNIHNHHFNHWSKNEITRLSVGQKISEKNKGNVGSWNKGKNLSEETKKKISKSTSIAMKEHYKENSRTEETRKKISENSKRLQKEQKIGMHGKKHKKETIDKMKENNAMKNPEHVAKVKVAKQGIRHLRKNEIRKMAIPGTLKFNLLIQEGFMVI